MPTDPDPQRSDMASQQFEGQEKRRFPTLVVAGLALGAVVIAAAFIADPEIGWPVLILTAICLAAAVTFRLVAGASRGDGSDSDADSAMPRQEARAEGPLGGTPEVHDELSPHDIPLDSPERHAAERTSSGADGATKGPIS
jgi:hypothetical protein